MATLSRSCDVAQRLRAAGPVHRRRILAGMTTRVECYAGHRGEQEPVAFWLGERRLAVQAIVDRWFGPTQRWFKVDAEDGDVYVLRHDETTGEWDLAAYRRGDRQ